MKPTRNFRADQTAVLGRICAVCDAEFATNDLRDAMCEECEYQTVAGRFRAPDVPSAVLPEADDEAREAYYGRESVEVSEQILCFCLYATFLLAMGALFAWGAGALVLLVGK